jgi:hypothetical protein
MRQMSKCDVFRQAHSDQTHMSEWFHADYETRVFHGVQYIVVAAEEEANDRANTNRMDEMLEAIQPSFNLDTEDPPTLKV